MEKGFLKSSSASKGSKGVGKSGVQGSNSNVATDVQCLKSNDEGTSTGIHLNETSLSGTSEYVKPVSLGNDTHEITGPIIEDVAAPNDSGGTKKASTSVNVDGNQVEAIPSDSSTNTVDNTPDGIVDDLAARMQRLKDANVNVEDNHVEPIPSDSSTNVARDATPNQVKPVSLGIENVAQESSMSGTGVKSGSYAGATSTESQKHIPNFRRLECSKKRSDVDLSIPMKVVEEVNLRFENTLYGYFLGQRLAFPVVDYYVRNTWAKYGIQKVMMNAKGFFFFKFNSKKGVDDVLDNGPWLIRNVPIILKPWTLNTNLLKEDLTNIPVWVKFHDVPLAMFSDDGLSLLATLIGTPKRLDAFTSQMCKESWGRSSFARCMIEVKSDVELKESLIVEIPLLNGTGFTIETIRVEYEWKPPRCDACKLFGHTPIECPKAVAPPTKPTPSVAVNDGFQHVYSRKKGKKGATNGTSKGGFFKPVVGKQFHYQPKKAQPATKLVDTTIPNTDDVASTSGSKIGTSNQFAALSMDDTDMFGIPTNDTNKVMESGCFMEANEDESPKTGNASRETPVSNIQEKEHHSTNTPIVKKIGDLEKLLIDGIATLVDDDGKPIKQVTSPSKRSNPFSKVGDIVVSDSDEDEVEDMFDETRNLFGGGHDREDEFDDYDDYDDYSKQVRDLPGNLDAFNAMYGTKLQAHRK